MIYTGPITFHNGARNYVYRRSTRPREFHRPVRDDPPDVAAKRRDCARCNISLVVKGLYVHSEGFCVGPYGGCS